ncbi:hypothetical protein [Tersicoccus sp. Bi-70]|uniref:AAA family ATPase n=1 Tax=Tersicoccus sp. Bi-70 TaxID=1897634 RepID=UPI000975749B|nr:hypothetical protein [Tersicoccus sp. Bi-70]OMH35174.1 hypothetical protein BGP79_02395 [Tersicoccus sp. Bi-70]
MSVPLAILGDTPADHVAGLERLRGPVTVVRRCAEPADLLAVCESGLAEVALIADAVDDLPGHLLERMTASGIPVLALTADRERAAWLSTLGVRVLPPAITTADLAAAVLTAAANPPERTGRSTAGSGASEPVDTSESPGRPGLSDVRTSSDPRGPSDPHGPTDLHGPVVSSPGPEADAETGGMSDASDGGSGEGNAAGRSGHDGVRGATRAGTTGGSRDQPGDEIRDEARDEPGVVIAVWGPTGAPGRSTIAVNLAAELASDLGTAYLVDVDTYGSSTAVMLGLLDETAPVAQACRLADQGLLDVAGLHRVAADVVVGGGRLRALTGITRPDRWPEVRPSALSSVIDLCRATARATVIDCGFCLEADEELSFDTVAPRRNGATLRALEKADIVIAVGGADAIGLPRLVKGIAELAEAVPTATPVVAVNRVRRESVGRGSRQQIRAAWERYGPELPIAALLPADPAADAALLGGTVLRESAPGSALRAGIRSLVPSLLGCEAAERVRPAWFRRSRTTGRATALEPDGV